MSAARFRLAVLGLFLSCALSATPATGAAPDAHTPDGGRYYGPLVEGRLHGKGRLEWDSGTSYEGNFKDGRFDGQGRLKTKTYTYEGEFRAGDSSGQGASAFADGRKYRGEHLRGRLHGKGRFETASGDVYEGDFVEGELVGSGRLTAKNGATYDGRFRNWRPDGQGTLRQPNGDVYQGAFARGLYEGAGTLTYAKPQADGRTQDEGVWRHGQLRDEARERQAYVNVETALYNQRALLDRALDALKPRDPSKINLYLLAIGGDGSQEVFRREVEFVREQFDSRFGTEGRSVVLVNSRNTVSTAPMATVSSIRETLKALVSKMDRENDILFLFMTSHGSEEHEFTLAQNNMRLRGLKAKELAGILAETPIRWKVVVVSACYSGGFIGPLAGDGTLVITAARHDRRSFGCSDDNDFTYFGRALFKEALPAAESFPDAFRRAEVLVRKWETGHADGPAPESEYSLPQMSAPAAVTEHMRRWWSQVSQARPRVQADSGAGARKNSQDLNEAPQAQP